MDNKKNLSHLHDNQVYLILVQVELFGIAGLQVDRALASAIFLQDCPGQGCDVWVTLTGVNLGVLSDVFSVQSQKPTPSPDVQHRSSLQSL